jgi:hypothetical protein
VSPECLAGICESRISQLEKALDAMREAAILKSHSYMNIGDWELAEKVIDGVYADIVNKRAGEIK